MDLTRQRGFDVADELLPDELRAGVCVANPVGVRHHDEVDPGQFPRLLGERLQHLRGVGRFQRIHHPRSVCERLRCRHRTALRLDLGVVKRLEDQRKDRARHEQDNDHRLQDEHLPGYASRTPAAQ